MSKAVFDKDSREEWDDRTSRSVYMPAVVDLDSMLFKHLFDRYLPKKKMAALEIGAIPGRFLVYLHKKFGYDISGLDFSANSSSFHETMKLNGVKNYTFIDKDFLKFSSSKQYDVVLSFGFVEHFNNFEEVVLKHCALVKDGGYLFIEMPNFRKLQYIYHYLFDRKSLKIHNTDAMDLKKLGNIVQNEGFKCLFSGYSGKLETWREPDPIGPIMLQINRLIMWFLRHFGMRFPTSSLYSPFMVAIYRRGL